MSKHVIECPVCRARVGDKCVTTGRTGKQKKRKDHTARLRAAKVRR